MSGWGDDNGKSSHRVYMAGGETKIIHPLSWSLFPFRISCKDYKAALHYE